MSATIVIRMLPPRECSPNFHGSWGAKAKQVALFREEAVKATRYEFSGDVLTGDGVIMDAEIAWCCGRRKLDDDNAWGSLKAARDGIADVLFGGEDRLIVQGRLTQVRGEGTTTVVLRERSSEGEA